MTKLWACLLLGASAVSLAAPSSAAAPSLVEILDQPIDGFYGKRLMDGRIPILGHATVSDEALLAARDRLEKLIAHAPRLRANLEASGYELHISGLRQYTSDLPEFQADRGTKRDNGQLFDWHMIGGHLSARSSSCTEGTLLPIVGHRLYGDDSCVHELGHAIEWIGMSEAGRKRIAQQYERSIGSGHWKDQYAAKNAHEWFAEVTKYYFRSVISADFYDPAMSRGREWLCGYDPVACAFVRDLYSGSIDPGTITIVDVPGKPGREEAHLRSERTREPTRLLVHNRSRDPVKFVWVDFDGARDKRPDFVNRPPVAPGAERMVPTFPHHVWVATDTAGHALCVFVAPQSDGRVEISGACE